MSSDPLATDGPRSVRRPARCEDLPLDRRGYPIIATVSRDNDVADFGSLSERRKLALATFDLCAVCAAPFSRESRWQVALDPAALDQPSAWFAEPPVHEICALYAAQVCPFVSSPYARLGDERRRGQKRPDAVYLLGYKRTAAVIGQQSGLQPGTGVLHFEMADCVARHTLRTAADAAAQYEKMLRDEASLALDPGERVLVEVLNNATPEEREDSGAVMAGAAWYVGAAFCPGIREVQGMSLFAEHALYTKIAQAIIGDPIVAHQMADVDDVATRAAMKWFITRAELPEVLQQWRRLARRRQKEDQSRSPRSTASDQRKAKRKSAAVARRRNRR